MKPIQGKNGVQCQTGAIIQKTDVQGIEFLNKVFCNNCIKIIPTMPDNFIDLIVTSPPYNVDLQGYDFYHDKKDHARYIKWLKKVFKQIYPKMKKGGRVAIVIGDGKNGKVPSHMDVADFMRNDLGYLPMTNIVWNKKNVLNRCSWGTFQSPSNLSLPTPFEYIMVFAKDLYKLQSKGETDLTRKEFIDWSLSLWVLPMREYIKNIMLIKNRVHPAPFPEEIPIRLIKMFSWIGATVFDPFNGIGTTCIAAKKLKRNYIGIDLSDRYCRIAEKKLKYTITSYTLFEERK